MKLLLLQESTTKSNHKNFQYFRKLCAQIPIIRLEEDTIRAINERINLINETSGDNAGFNKLCKKKAHEIVKLLQQKHRIVTRSYYQNMWMAVGMSAFGLPIGIAFSVAIDNYAFIAIGLPIGMVIGTGIGKNMDEKAKAEGRLIDITYS